MRSQATSNILMIRPVKFGFNEQTALSNAFQDASFAEANKENAHTQALREFDDMVAGLRKAGVNVIVINDTPNPHTPDSIFPNNWVSFHNNGAVVLYPMQAENRRLERRQDILESIGQEFFVDRIIDLSDGEAQNQFLEGTGSMVLDRRFHVAYACTSPRTHEDILEQFGRQMNYSIVKFKAVDGANQEIYHTNVLMCVGEMFAVVCLEAIPDPDERLTVRRSLEQTGKRVVEITLEQMNSFAGNMLQVKNSKGQNLIVMSSAAYHSLTETQRKVLAEYGSLQHFDLGMIEGNGGGSARCMMAEVHLPKK
jgi:hypothetical protein